MARKYNTWSFYLCLFCILLFSYSVYAEINYKWVIAPAYAIFLFTLVTFVLGLIGFQDKNNWMARVRSWITVLISFLLSAVLSFFVFMMIIFGGMGGGKESIFTTHSPDDKYTVDFFVINEGAAGTIRVEGELNGPLWFTKKIYYEKRVELKEVQWINNHTIKIKRHTLNLENGESYIGK